MYNTTIWMTMMMNAIRKRTKNARSAGRTGLFPTLLSTDRTTLPDIMNVPTAERSMNKRDLIEQSMDFSRMCLLKGLCTQREFERAMKKLKKEKEEYDRSTSTRTAVRND